jgi:PHD/YefM family antitoxin component YafN of YafNO toxin-antitoxin module
LEGEHPLIEHTVLISEAQYELANLPDQFCEELAAVIVTRNDKKVLTILPYSVYKALLETIESLQETLEIVKDPEMMAALRESIQALERGETVSLEDVWEDIKKEGECE